MFIISSTAASVARATVGHTVGKIGPRPRLPLELFDKEACPYCRKVREALTMLDLDVIVRPSPSGGTRYRPEAITRGGKAQFPLLVDPNVDLVLYESDAIVAHLYANYGAGKPPMTLRLGALGNVSSGLASVLRAGAGRAVRPNRPAAVPLALWSFEASPFSRYVREALSELELAYVLHNLGRGSAKRAAFRAQHGRVMVPYLEDANTGAAMFESRDIVRYLDRTYGGAPS